jgi:hypothetical protein
LIFSVQEAKGLEYENVILVDFVSGHEAEFREIIAGVTVEDLHQEALRYNRAGDKSDKDAEIYKFYINSFYVAVTRAIKNIYIFERLSAHPALQLLQMQETKAEISVKETKSTREEWLNEARRLEEQGKYEQAEQIRAKYLGYEYLSPEQLEVVKTLALDPAKKESEVKRERKQLFQYAIHHRQYDWVDALAKLQFQRAILFMKEIRAERREYEKHLRLGDKFKVESVIQKYGVDFTCEGGASGLMMALQYGQAEIALDLVNKGASLTLADNSSRLAMDWLLASYIKNKRSNQKQFANEQTLIRCWRQVCPPAIEYEYGKRRFRVGSHSMLFFLIVLIRNTADSQPSKAKVVFNGGQETVVTGAFNMTELEQFAAMMPDEILPPYRKKRTYINSIMALHEKEKPSPYCKAAFLRVERGWYVLNPHLEMGK